MRFCFVAFMPGLAAVAIFGGAEAKSAEKYPLRKDLSGFHRTVTTTSAEAKKVDEQFQTAWSRSDIKINSSCYCRKGSKVQFDFS